MIIRTGIKLKRTDANFIFSIRQGKQSVSSTPQAFFFKTPQTVLKTADMVELIGIEPMTSCLQSTRSPN
jgi:hypothetical protein